MTLESLEILNDEQLQAVIARAGELLKQRERALKQKALADARAILVSAGISLKELKSKAKKPKTASPAA